MRHKLTLILFLIFVFLLRINVSSQDITKAPWNEYIGSHYDTEPWGGWVRDYSMKTASRSYMLNTELEAGALDPNIIAGLVNELYNEMLKLPVQYDAVLQTSSVGRDLDGVKQYMQRIEADGGATWRELCKQQALKLTELPNGKNRIFWQIGNEISSPAYSEYLNSWAGNPVPCNGNGCDYDPFVMPIYAECYFAPSVQGIQEASMQLYGSKDSINIILGSLTNAGGNAPFNWLNSLLSYTIEGKYAPDLAGKKVYELIDIISVHYMVGNSSPSFWKTWLDKYRDAWFGVGKIKGIWSTEEVGIRAAEQGQGAARGAAATSRYLEWALTNNYSPYQCRTNYWAHWAGPVGSRVDDLNQEVYNFLGNSQLLLVNQDDVKYDNPDIESHAFLSSDSKKGIIYTLLKNATQSDSVSAIDIANYGMGNITSATSHYFSPSGHQVIQPGIENENSTFHLDLKNSYSFESGNAVLVTFIQTGTSNTGIPPVMKDISVSIYPNPAKSSFAVELPEEKFDLLVIDLSGKYMTIKKNVSRKTMIDCSDFPGGIYILKVVTEDKIFAGRIVKQ